MTTFNADPFADFADSDLDAVPTYATPKRESKVYYSDCSKCGGDGLYRAPSSLGHNKCTACKGVGKIAYKTSPEQREKARIAAQNRKAAAAQKEKELGEQRLKEFEAANPGFAEWWTNSEYEFPCSLRNAVVRWGKLTDNQMAAAKRTMEKVAAMRAEREARTANAPVVDTGPIEAAFGKANVTGLRTPKLRAAGFTFSPAKAISVNAGAIYVKAGETYLGKIMNGKFMAVRDCTPEQTAAVLRVAADPKGAAIAYGRETGTCAICARQLDNPASIELGIGPICASKFF